LYAEEVDTNDDEEEERNEEVQILPDGYKLNDDNNNQITLDNPNTWPINTEKARRLRKEFVQEGFRKLYTVAAGCAINTIEENENHNNSVHGGDEVAAELRQATGVEETDAIPTEVSVEDWVYLAQ